MDQLGDMVQKLTWSRVKIHFRSILKKVRVGNLVTVMLMTGSSIMILGCWWHLLNVDAEVIVKNDAVDQSGTNTFCLHHPKKASAKRIEYLIMNTVKCLSVPKIEPSTVLLSTEFYLKDTKSRNKMMCHTSFSILQSRHDWFLNLK